MVSEAKVAAKEVKHGTPDERSKLSIWLIKRSDGYFSVYSGRITFRKRNHWLLVAVYVGICLERPSTVAIKLLICSLVAFMAFKCASCSALCAGLDLRCLAWLKGKLAQKPSWPEMKEPTKTRRTPLTICKYLA